MFKSFRYRLQPTSEQASQFQIIVGCCRFVYNQSLDLQFNRLDAKMSLPSTFDLNRKLPALREKFPWLAECSTIILRTSLANSVSAMGRYIARTSGRPRFKKRGIKDAFGWSQECRVNDRFVFVPKVGWVRLNCHRQMQGKPKQIYVVREGKHWFLEHNILFYGSV